METAPRVFNLNSDTVLSPQRVLEREHDSVQTKNFREGENTGWFFYLTRHGQVGSTGTLRSSQAFQGFVTKEGKVGFILRV